MQIIFDVLKNIYLSRFTSKKSKYFNPKEIFLFKGKSYSFWKEMITVVVLISAVA